MLSLISNRQQLSPDILGVSCLEAKEVQLKLSSLALPPWPRGPTRIPVKLDHLEEVKVYVCHRGSLHGLDSLVQPALLDGVGVGFFIQVTLIVSGFLTADWYNWYSMTANQ